MAAPTDEIMAIWKYVYTKTSVERLTLWDSCEYEYIISKTEIVVWQSVVCYSNNHVNGIWWHVYFLFATAYVEKYNFRIWRNVSMVYTHTWYDDSSFKDYSTHSYMQVGKETAHWHLDRKGMQCIKWVTCTCVHLQYTEGHMSTHFVMLCTLEHTHTDWQLLL